MRWDTTLRSGVVAAEAGAADGVMPAELADHGQFALQ